MKNANFLHQVNASPQNGGVYIDIRENFYDKELADWALLSPKDAYELRCQIDNALTELGFTEKAVQ